MRVQKYLIATIRYVALVVARLLNNILIGSLAESMDVNSAIIALKLASNMRRIINNFKARIRHVHIPIKEVFPRRKLINLHKARALVLKRRLGVVVLRSVPVRCLIRPKLVVHNVHAPLHHLTLLRAECGAGPVSPRLCEVLKAG
jgi:hypothetical protein